MKFHFSNVGPIISASIELGALTIICGKNNTGKTYLTNSLYEFYKFLRGTTIKVREEVDPQQDEVIINLEDYRQTMVDAIQERAQQFVRSARTLHGGTLSIELNPEELPLSCSVPKSIWSSRDHRWKFEVNKNNSVLKVTRRESIGEGDIVNNEDGKRLWHTVLNTLVNAYLFRQNLNNGFIGDACALTSERMGISYFKDCIDIALRVRNQRADSFLGRADLERTDETPKEFSLFPPHVYAMLDMMSYFGQQQKNQGTESRSFLAKTFTALEDLVGGTFGIKNDKIFFTPKNVDNLELDVQDTSSSVRALFALDMYVRYFAEKGDLLVIDEPEMNLHPEKQRLCARYLATLVNSGINVVVATHSDYIIREFNTLIMLKDEDTRMARLVEKYHYDPFELLSVKDIKGYMLSEGSIVPLPLSQEQGLEVVTFDQSSREINTIQSDILFGRD